MRAISAAIITLAGVVLFAAGFVPVALAGEGRFKDWVVIGLPGAGLLLALVGFVCWIGAFFGGEK
jgi:hypothetical protein